MAGFYGAALGGALQGYNQAQAQQPENMMRMLQIQQAIRAQQLQNIQMQANMRGAAALQGSNTPPPQQAPMIPPQAYGQVSPDYFGPQAPAPGQASMPMQKPAAAGGIGPKGIMPYLPMQAHIAANQGSPVTSALPVSQVQQQQSYAPPAQDQSASGSVTQVPPEVKAYHDLYRKVQAMDPMAQQSPAVQYALKTAAAQAKMAMDEQRLQNEAQYRDALLASKKTQDKGTWGPLKTINGVQTQQNSATGEIRTAVSRPPRITVSTGEGGGKAPNGYRWSDASKTTLEPIKGGPADPSNLSDAGVDFAIQQSFLGDKSAIQGLSRNPAMRARILNRIPAVAASMNLSPSDVARQQAEFQGFSQGEKTLGARQANIELAANVVKQFVPIAEAASDAYSRSGIRSLNDLQNAINSRTASPELRRLNASINAVVNAYSRAVNPSGVGSDTDKAEARKILDSGFANGDFHAAADQLLVEINAELKAPGAVKAGMKTYFAGKGAAPTAAAKPTVSNW